MKPECKKPVQPKNPQSAKAQWPKGLLKTVSNDMSDQGLPTGTASRQTWSNNTTSRKAIHQFFKCDIVKNLTEWRQHIGARPVHPYENCSCSCISPWQVHIRSPLLDTESPQPAYQESILFQGYKTRLDLDYTTYLSRTFVHNSERTTIANCLFF